MWWGYIIYLFRYWAETIFQYDHIKMISVTSKIRSRSTGSNLVFTMPWCFSVPNLVRIHQLFLQILSGNHLSHAVALKWPLWPRKLKVKVTRFELGCRLALVLLCTKNWWGYVKYFPRYLAETILSTPTRTMLEDNTSRFSNGHIKTELKLLSLPTHYYSGPWLS